jgi:proteasome inhibitor subunit 1 (PI31)
MTDSAPSSPPNPLSPLHLLSLLPSLLPSPSSSDTSATTPSISSPSDLLVSLIHTIHISLGFRLSSTLHNSDRVLPRRWNANRPDSYKMEYKHEQSSLTYLVRVGMMGGRAMVDAMALEVRPFLPRRPPLSSFFFPLLPLLTNGRPGSW